MDLAKHTILHGVDARYQVVSRIDNGGVGTVFEARRMSDKKPVAVKVLHGGRFPITDTARERFHREIEVALRLPSHPNVVGCLDFGDHDGDEFLVMEYLAGGTVGQRVKRTDYTDDVAYKWCKQLAEGVSFLHSRGCIHRDLKPNNLLLTGAGDLKIADLGIVRDSTSEAYLTLAGDQIGSVLYISWHQRENPDEADEEDDAYAACCCIYEILSRRRIHPFVRDLGELVNGLPVLVTDLVMGGLQGSDKCESLRCLETCFEIREGKGHLCGPATCDAVVERIALACSGPERGRKRYALAAASPLHQVSRASLGTGQYWGIKGLAFIDDERVAVFSEGRQGCLHLFRHREGSLEFESEQPWASPSRSANLSARLSLSSAGGGRYLLATEEKAVHVFDVDPRHPVLVGTLTSRDLFMEQTEANDLASIGLCSCHPHSPNACISSPRYHPRHLDLVQRKVVVLDAIPRGARAVYVGDSHLAAFLDGAWNTLQEDPEGCGRLLIFSVDSEGRLGDPVCDTAAPEIACVVSAPGGASFFGLSRDSRVWRFDLHGARELVLDAPDLSAPLWLRCCPTHPVLSFGVGQGYEAQSFLCSSDGSAYVSDAFGTAGRGRTEEPIAWSPDGDYAVVVLGMAELGLFENALRH